MNVNFLCFLSHCFLFRCTVVSVFVISKLSLDQVKIIFQTFIQRGLRNTNRNTGRCLSEGSYLVFPPAQICFPSI